MDQAPRGDFPLAIWNLDKPQELALKAAVALPGIPPSHVAAELTIDPTRAESPVVLHITHTPLLDIRRPKAEGQVPSERVQLVGFADPAILELGPHLVDWEISATQEYGLWEFTAKPKVTKTFHVHFEVQGASLITRLGGL